jgi:hypothetical protein
MPTVQELAQQSGFIFEAQIETLGASTAPGFRASEETTIVSVAKIFRSPESLTSYAGHRITVVLKTPISLVQGQSAVFFTHGVHYGRGLVVREFGNLPPETTMDSQVNAAMQSERDSQLTNRLAQAESVITGVASAPKPLAVTAPGPSRVSEHDPDWWVSTINVETAEKGPHPGPTKDIVYANSRDIAWYNSPKVKVGDRGIWLLHNRDHRGKAVPGPAVIHPLDFQPIDQLDHVRSLISTSKPQ